MNESLFPSGPWRGYYNYGAGRERHRMELQLAFANRAMTGNGVDDIGRFLVKGRYDGSSGECHWTKTYIGAHDVFYSGFREGKGIWGTWEIQIQFHGGFHIWPLGLKEGEAEEAKNDEAERLEAVGTNF